MINIITAIGNENLNIKLKKEKEINIMLNDIQYKEGILEALENNSYIDFVIISSILPGEISIQELIKKIICFNLEIKIIIFIEQDEKNLETELQQLGVYKVLYDNQLKVNELIEILLQPKNDNEELKTEINKLKNIILEKEKNNILQERSKLKINYLLQFIPKKIVNKNSINPKTICITGPANVGKSMITINLAKTFCFLKNKIAILDFDIFYNSIQTILGLKNTSFSSENYFLKSKIKINKKMDLFIFKMQKENNLIKNNYSKFTEEIKLSIKKEINNLQQYYDLILIDTNYQNLFKITNNIILFSDFTIFISDTNLLEITKSIHLLDSYINSYQIPKNKFNIVFNKYNKNSIEINILKNIFSEFDVIGKLNYNEIYNTLINKNRKNTFQNKKLRKEYLEIIKKMDKKERRNENGIRKK